MSWNYSPLLPASPSSGAGADALTADSIASGTPAVDAPALGQIHALAAVGAAAGQPFAGLPVLGEPGEEPVAVAGPGPLFLSPKAYRALQAKRRKAEDEFERLRQAEEDRRRKLRAMIGRAVRGEAEPQPEPDMPALEETPAPTARKSRRVAAAAADMPDNAAAEARIAALGKQIADLKARIAAHEDAEEEDDIETLMLLAA